MNFDGKSVSLRIYLPLPGLNTGQLVRLLGYSIVNGAGAIPKKGDDAEDMFDDVEDMFDV